MKHYKSMGLFFGIIGAVALLAGNLFLDSDARYLVFLIGSGLLLITAIVYRQLYYIFLELILVSGSATSFLNFNSIVRGAIPMLLSLQVFLYFFMLGRFREKSLLIGCIGIALLSIGFAVANYWIYLFGSALVAIYSFLIYLKGVKVALLWTILNTCFTLASAYSLIFS